jgi:tRNA(Ile2) C34 agmatinyltransferase TiaS
MVRIGEYVKFIGDLPGARVTTVIATLREVAQRVHAGKCSRCGTRLKINREPDGTVRSYKCPACPSSPYPTEHHTWARDDHQDGLAPLFARITKLEADLEALRAWAITQGFTPP